LVTGAVNMGQFSSAMNNVSNALSGLSQEIGEVRGEARRGIAAAVAMASPLMPSAPGKTTVNGSMGFYKGEVGVGVSVAHRLNFDIPVMVHAGYANGGGNEHVGRVGLSFEF